MEPFYQWSVAGENDLLISTGMRKVMDNYVHENRAEVAGERPSVPSIATSWNSLDYEQQLVIASIIWDYRDRDSVISLMQTSRELRDMISMHLIGALRVTDASSLRGYPPNAPIRALELAMAGPSATVAWLK